MEQPILRCENLNKSFGKKHILKNVTIEVYEGDIVAFIGPNGSGKTTTIKLSLGLQTIDSGTVTINGYNIEKDFDKAIERVGAIVENPDLYMYLSGRKNLELIANMYKGITKDRINEVIKIVGLEARINDKVSKYSLGMRQRLGIAQALLHKPNVLILDEPTNGLDPEGIKDMRTLLTRLATKEKMAILVSSHNLSELESFCTKACIIKNGEIVETNTVKNLKKDQSNSYYLLELSTTENLNIKTVPFEVLNDREIKVHTTKTEIANLIKELVNNNVDIYSASEKELTLEEAFLNKTGGNIID